MEGMEMAMPRANAQGLRGEDLNRAAHCRERAAEMSEFRLQGGRAEGDVEGDLREPAA